MTQLGNMFLKSRTVQVLAPHPVVPTMHSNTMVINYPSRIDSALEVFISFMAVEFELQSFHDVYL